MCCIVYSDDRLLLEYLFYCDKLQLVEMYVTFWTSWYFFEILFLLTKKCFFLVRRPYVLVCYVFFLPLTVYKKIECARKLIKLDHSCLPDDILVICNVGVF